MLNNWFKQVGDQSQQVLLPPPKRDRKLSWLVYLIVIMLISVVSQKIVSMFGPEFLLVIVGLAIFVVVYALVSFRSLFIPFLVLIAAVGALRFMWSFRTPILPDLYFDRISLIWLMLIFTISIIYNRTPMRKPFTLDLLLILHGGYIGARILLTDPPNIHIWSVSDFTPYMIFFFAKNLVRTRRQMDIVLKLLIVLSVYYTITSISEKFHIKALLYPPMMIEPHFEAAGRSSGPFRAPGIFGDTMAMLLPIFLYFLHQAKNNGTKLLWGLGLVMGFVGILFTYTRGCMLGAVIGIIVVVAFNRKAYLKYVLPVLIILPIVAIRVVGVQDDEFLEERIEATNPIESRLGALVTGVRMWRHNSLFGVGPYQFKDYVEKYVAPVEVPLMGTIGVRRFRHHPGHDMYVAVLAETGSVGGILQFLVYIVIIRTSLQKLRLRRQQDHFATYILPLFFSIYAIYFFGGLIISFRYFSILQALFYMAAGITYGYNPDEAEDYSNEI